MKRMTQLLMLLLGVGCVTPAQQRVELLGQNVREWNADVRWARYENAAASLPPDEAKSFLKRVDQVEKDLIIADFEVVNIKVGEPSTKATVIVRFEWYSQSRPIVSSSVIEQRWEFIGGVWMVQDQKRLRGERFALVPEVASDEAPKATPEKTSDVKATP
jgi:hypothetical protein